MIHWKSLVALDSIILGGGFIVLSVLGYKAVGLKADISPIFDFKNFIEAQSVLDEEKTSMAREIQSTTGSAFRSGKWQNDNHVLFKPTEDGESAFFTIPPLLCQAPCQLNGYFTRSFDFAIVEILVNGEPLEPRMDLYAPIVLSTGPRRLATITNPTLPTYLEFKVVGHSSYSQAPYRQFGIDGFSFVGAER